MFKAFHSSITAPGLLFTALFSLAAGFLLRFLSGLGGRRLLRFLTGLWLFLLALFFGVHAVYHDIFSEYLSVGMLGVAGGALTGYWREALRGTVRCLPELALILLPFGLWLGFGKRLTRAAPGGRGRKLLPLALFLAFQLAGSAGVRLARSGAVPLSSLYGEGFVMEAGVRSFGLLTAQRIDAAQALEDARELREAQANATPAPEPTPTPLPTPTPVPTPTPEVFTPEPQTLEIDFDSLIANEWDPELIAVHEFVRDSEPSWTNEYTGMFRGKNLVWICAESFSTWALDEEHTPTLYELAHSGFVFENFYCPITAASTTGGEFITLTGLMQNSSKQYMLASAGSYMPYGMGNVLNPLGYTSIAYHGGQYTYYSRNETLPNLGYEFKANTRGIDLDEPWLLPTSDLDLVRNTVDDYIGREPFNIYIMSISGHMDYVFGGGHDICSRYKDEVQDLTEPTTPAKAYIASQMDFDLAVEYLINSLDEAGILDETVLVISADHYPYGLDEEDIESIAGEDLDPAFDLEHSTLILWCSEMEEPVYVDKYCESSDILPTLLNLFGVPFDSRLMMGRDILWEGQDFAAFRNYSFISDYGRYNAATGEFTPAEGAPEPPEGYVQAMVDEIRQMYSCSKTIVYKNYYGKVFG